MSAMWLECENFDLQTKSPDLRVTSPPWNKFNRAALETRFTSDASSSTEPNHAAAPRFSFALRAPPIIVLICVQGAFRNCPISTGVMRPGTGTDLCRCEHNRANGTAAGARLSNRQAGCTRVNARSLTRQEIYRFDFLLLAVAFVRLRGCR